MLISVIICTYNRSKSLGGTLCDLSRICPPGGYCVEIIVIDNNSTDNTAGVVEDCTVSMPYPVRYVKEMRQGISHARNRGICEARGDWIVFTDDDVRIEANWLNALSSQLRDCESAAGGRVLTLWPDTLPSWVATEGPYVQTGVFVQYDLGATSRQLCELDSEPFTCNAAFHSNLFRKFGNFRADLGRSGNRLMSGEDAEMFARLRAVGVPVYYVAEAVVHHPVEQYRLSLGYLLRWMFWGGYGDGRSSNPRLARSLLRVPVYHFRVFVVALWRSICGLVRCNSTATVHACGIALFHIGFIIGAWFGRPPRNTVP